MASSASFEEQCDSLQSGTGFVELADWSSVTVTGADRQKFLHNFCTNDVNGLTPGSDCEAFFTNAKGKVIGHGVISCRDNELVFLGAPNQAARLVEHLDRYIIRDDVHLRDTTGERAYFHVNLMPPATTARCIGWNLLGLNPGTLVEVIADYAPQVRQMLSERKYIRCGSAAFDSMRIEAGTPLFGVDFNEDNLPQEVNRDRQAISFTKGCYLGQETVARIDALGHVNQKLIGVRFAGADVPAVGTELTKDGARVGRVTSAACSPQLRAPMALAMVRRESNAVGTALESLVGRCEVISLPIEPTDN